MGSATRGSHRQRGGAPDPRLDREEQAYVADFDLVKQTKQSFSVNVRGCDRRAVEQLRLAQFLIQLARKSDSVVVRIERWELSLDPFPKLVFHGGERFGGAANLQILPPMRS